MKLVWLWHGFYWRFYIAWYADFMSSEDKNVRRAWWFLWHGKNSQFSSGSRCYRFCGITLHGRARISPGDTTASKP